jgi:dTDP-3-amino-3,4,6-trideoxy-alpha-D-glucose transaminase
MIRMNDFQRQWNDTREAAMASFAAVGGSGWYVLGKEVREFETALAEFWGLPHAVGVASGLDAIEISLRILNCRPGDRVLTTPISAFATTLAITRIGAVPVFVDCDTFGLIDLDEAASALEADPTIRYFVPVHLYGHALDLGRLAEIGEKFGCRIVEDCAQSIGATHQGKPTGSAGDIAASSFYPTKNLGAMGDGGVILSAKEEHADRARVYRDYGQSAKYRHEVLGYNSRLDELQAALLHHVYLASLPGWIEQRQRITRCYASGISNPAICLSGSPPSSNSTWHLFPVLVDAAHKQNFMTWLQTNEIGCGEHYPIPIPDQPAMKQVEFYQVGDLSTARRLCASEVSLPIHPYLTNEEVARVIEVCNRWRPH